MAPSAVALKQEGSHSPSEGVLARFAQVRSIRSASDLEKVQEARPDIVLIDLRMPRVDGSDIVEVLRRSHRAPVLVLYDSKAQPATLLKQLNSLGSLKARHHRRAPSLSKVLRLLGVSQEVLSRVLGVSARTVHRWLKGSRPRRIRELDRLLDLVALLEQSLPTEDAIRSYLGHANPALHGERPIDMLIRGEFDRLAADLQALQEGVYV